MRFLKIFIVSALSVLFLFSCDESDKDSNIPRITSVPEKKVFPNYPWDENVEESGNNIISGEFEIFNKGEKELRITQINFLDPDGNLLKDSENETFRKLFDFQVQKTENGIVKNEWGDKTLTFDNSGSDLLSLCPLESTAAKDKKCDDGFSASDHNRSFKILLNYNRSAAEALKNNPVNSIAATGDFQIEICTNDPLKKESATCKDGMKSFRIQVTRLPNKDRKSVV